MTLCGTLHVVVAFLSITEYTGSAGLNLPHDVHEYLEELRRVRGGS